MNEKNLQKLEFAKKVLDDRNIIYHELANGQFQVDGINFWATSEKWYDPKKNVKGVGLNSFLKYINN